MGPCVTVNTKGIVNNGAGLGMRQKWGAPNGFIVFFVVGSPPPALMSHVHRTSFLMTFLFSHYSSTSTCTIVNTNWRVNNRSGLGVRLGDYSYCWRMICCDWYTQRSRQLDLGRGRADIMEAVQVLIISVKDRNISAWFELSYHEALLVYYSVLGLLVATVTVRPR